MKLLPLKFPITESTHSLSLPSDSEHLPLLIWSPFLEMPREGACWLILKGAEADLEFQSG